MWELLEGKDSHRKGCFLLFEYQEKNNKKTMNNFFLSFGGLLLDFPLFHWEMREENMKLQTNPYGQQENPT